jgi:hypothetical protein
MGVMVGVVVAVGSGVFVGRTIVAVAGMGVGGRRMGVSVAPAGSDAQAETRKANTNKGAVGKIALAGFDPVCSRKDIN